MTKYITPNSAGSEDLKWLIELIPGPGADEGMQTLYGLFDDFRDAIEFAKEEFKEEKWKLRSVWPVFPKQEKAAPVSQDGL